MFKYFTATGVVFNKKNEILMVKHKRFGLWMPPGGQLEEGEAPHEAVVREILEETGLQAEIIPMLQGVSALRCNELPRPFAVLSIDVHDAGEYVLHDTWYLCRLVGGELSASLSEVDGAGWFSYEEFKRLETFPNVAKMVDKAVEYMSGE